MSDHPDGAPVGRRVVLGLLGLGALGIVGGARLQTGLSAALAPVQLRDPTGLVALFPFGNTFRYGRVAGGVAEQTAEDYRLTVSGVERQAAGHSLADLRAMPQT